MVREARQASESRRHRATLLQEIAQQRMFRSGVINTQIRDVHSQQLPAGLQGLEDSSEDEHAAGQQKRQPVNACIVASGSIRVDSQPSCKPKPLRRLRKLVPACQTVSNIDSITDRFGDLQVENAAMAEAGPTHPSNGFQLRVREEPSETEADKTERSLGSSQTHVAHQDTAEQSDSSAASPSQELHDRSLSARGRKSEAEAVENFGKAAAEHGLCLGDEKEFKLDKAVSQKLYAHQVSH
jgi:peptidyl-tRNA hydrolase